MSISETSPDIEKFFGGEVLGYNRKAISDHGMPKYPHGTKLELKHHASVLGPAKRNKFVVESILWSEVFGCWTYLVPHFNFYQCESDLKEIK